MVVNMGYNHCVQDIGSLRHPGEYGRKILVLQEKVSCSSRVLVDCKEMKNTNDHETTMIQY